MTSQQIPHDIYKWLSSLEVLPNNLRYKNNGNFQIDSKNVQNMISGYLIKILLIKIATITVTPLNIPLLSSIKQSNTPASRLYNWSILADNFLKININIGKDLQKQIISNNFQTLSRLLIDLYRKFGPKNAQIKKLIQNKQTLIDIQRLQQLNTLTDAQTFTQSIIILINQNIGLTSKQSISTLIDNAKYFAHMVVKGIKNNFTQILNLLQSLNQNLNNLVFQCQKNPQKNTEMFLDLIKPTLISRSLQVAQAGINVFCNLIQESMRYNNKNLIYQILCKQEAGFDFIYMSQKRHPFLQKQLSKLIILLAGNVLHDFFQVHTYRTINNQQQYVKFILFMIQSIKQHQNGDKLLKNSKLIQKWIKKSKSYFINAVSKQQHEIKEQTKLYYLELYCFLVQQFGQQFKQNQTQEHMMTGIDELKRNSRSDIFTIKIPSIYKLFNFLYFFAKNKYKIAPILYKKLIFLFIQNHADTQIREIFLNNFKTIFKQFSSIPIDLFIQPFLKQLIVSQGTTYVLNIFDFQFLIQMCKHPKLQISFALSYLEWLSKLYTKNLLYSKLIMRVMQILTARFCQQDTIIQFIKKTIDNTLNNYGIFIFNKKKSTKQQQIFNNQKKSLSIQLVKHFLTLQHDDLTKYILAKVLDIYTNWKNSKKYYDKGLQYLIQLNGDLEQLSIKYQINKSQIFNDIKTVQTIPKNEQINHEVISLKLKIHSLQNSKKLIILNQLKYQDKNQANTKQIQKRVKTQGQIKNDTSIQQKILPRIYKLKNK